MNTNKITHFPTQEQIKYHTDKAWQVYENEIVYRINTFIDSGEETISINSDEFEDLWVFALVMGLCGDIFFNSNIGVAYGRSDGVCPASIVIYNKTVKINRLNGELSKLEEKIKNITDTESSKYQKTEEKIGKLKEEISHIENSMENFHKNKIDENAQELINKYELKPIKK